MTWDVSFSSTETTETDPVINSGIKVASNFKYDLLGADDLDDILRAMGFRPSKEELKEILEEIDEDGSGERVEI